MLQKLDCHMEDSRDVGRNDLHLLAFIYHNIHFKQCLKLQKTKRMRLALGSIYFDLTETHNDE